MLNSVGLVPSRVSFILCYRVIVPLWVRNIFLLVFRAPEIFSRGYFVGPKFFHGHFVGPKFFLVGFSWVQDFFWWLFRESEVFSDGYFVGPNFSCGYFAGTHEYISQE